MIHFFRLFYRNLIRNKTFSVITISGFTLSLTVVLLLSAFVFNELSYDKSFSKVDRIYRMIKDDGESDINEDAIDYLTYDFPEIENVCRYNYFINFRGALTYNLHSTKVNQILHTEPSFFDIFDVDFVYGNKETALSDMNSIILTEEIAQKIFGERNPVGEPVTVYHKNDLTVSAVIKSLPENSSFQPKTIIHRDLKSVVNSYSDGDKIIYFNRYFVLLEPGSDVTAVNDKLSAHLVEHNMVKEAVSLMPLKDSYFSDVRDNSHLMHANLRLIRILGAIALLVLLISILNFVVLFTAQYMTRIKEIGTKKTVGAGSKAIFFQFILESVLIGTISLLAAILLSGLTKPLFESIVNKSFDMNYIYSMPTVLLIPAGLILISVLAGLFPAILASRYSVLSMFRNVDGNALKIKSGLLTVQYTVSIILITALIVIGLQMKHVKNMDWGFDKDCLVKIETSWRIKDKLPLLKQKIIESPQVYHVTCSNSGPGAVYMSCGWNEAKELGTWDQSVSMFLVDTDFFNVFDVPVIEGRNFNTTEKNNVIIINESARKLVNWESIEGKKINGNDVIGVVKDFHTKNMYKTLGPVFFAYDQDSYYTWLSLRIAPDNISGTLDYIKNVWGEVCPEFVLEYSFYDEWYDAMYKSEERLGFAIRIFSVIALLITAMGTFGVVQFTTRRRAKEVGIRKVNGASVREITVLLNRDMLKWTAIAFIIAVPVSWYIMNKWLESFAYRTELGWWIFAISGVAAISVALMTTSWQVIKTATANPVEALRYE